jgi:hypothetical protein
MSKMHESLRIDLRRMRADQLAHAIFRKVQPRLHGEDEDRIDRDVFYAILEVLYEAGVEVITDWQRAELGLPPRGPDGWTDDEVRAMEAMRMKALLQPISMQLHPLAP